MLRDWSIGTANYIFHQCYNFVSLSKDEELKANGVDNVADLFDKWLNVMPTGQGSRTIRTEEAILVALSAMRNKIFKY